MGHHGLILTISAYIASHGLESIFRTCFLIGILFLPLLTFVLLTAFQNADWRYVLPFFDVDFSFVTKLSYQQSFFAFTGGYLFLGFVQPYFTFKRKAVIYAALALIPVFLLAVYIPIFTFGQATASTFLFPFVVAVDTLDIDWLMFDRVTVFFLLSVVTFIMLLTSTILWKTSRVLHQFAPRVKPFYLIMALTVVVFISCMFIPDWNDLGFLFKWNTYLRFYTLLSIPTAIYYFGYRLKRKMRLENAA